MNIQRIRLLRTIFLVVVTWLGIQCRARAAYVGTVSTTNNLVFDINPNSANTNYYVVDQKALWLFDKGSSAVGTNALTSNFTGTGRWLWQWTGGNGGGLWTDFTTFIAPTAATNSMQLWTNGALFTGPETLAAYGAAGGNEALVSYSLDNNTRFLSIQSQASTNSAILGTVQAYTATNNANLLAQLVNPITGLSRTFVVNNQTAPLGDLFDLEMISAGNIEFKVLPPTGWSGSGTNWFGDDGKFHSTTFNTNGGNVAGTFTVPYYPRASGVNTLTDGALYASGSDVALDSKFIWGPGASNAVYRSGVDLVYTNQNASGTFIEVSSDGTHFTKYGSHGLAGSIYGPTGGAEYIFADSSALGGLVVTSTSIQPGQEVISIGADTSNGAWTNLWMKGKAHIQEVNDGVGNSARLDIFATNGIGIFDFENAGTGTPWTKFSFRSNGVEVAALPDGGGAGVNYWTNISSKLRPIDLTLPLSFTNDLASYGQEFRVRDNNTGAAEYWMRVQFGNTFVGAMSGNALTTGQENNGFGWESLKNITSGSYNTAIGEAMGNASTASRNTAVGHRALILVRGNDNVAVGYLSGQDDYTNSVMIGARSGIVVPSLTNIIAIGYNAKATNNNDVVIGNATNLNAYLPPNVYAGGVLLGPAGGGGGTVGTMVDTGIPVTNAVPVALDATGTNWGPSKMTFVQSDTNDLRQVWDAPAGMTATYEFRHVPSYATDGGGSYIDDIFQTGFNPQQTANNIKFYTQFESHFRINGTSPFKSEYHHDWRSTNNLLVIQPFGYEVVHTNGAVTGFFNGLWGWNDSYGNQEFKKTESGTLSFVGGDQVIAFDTNNSVVLRMNGTNGLAQNLPYVDAGNDLVISQPLVATGNQLTITNSDIRMDNGRVLSWVGNTGTKRTILYMGGTTVTLDNPEGNLIINKLPYFVSGGAWASARGTLSVNVSAVGNLGSSATNLMTYTLPANLLTGTSSMGLINTCAGTFEANSNNKQIQVYLNTDLLFDTGTLAANGGSWHLTTEIIRTGASSQVTTTSFTSSSTLLPASTGWAAGTAPMTAATNVFKVVVTAAADNDVVQRLMRNEVAGGN